MAEKLTYNTVLNALQWYLKNKLIPFLLCEATIDDYINDNTNFDRLCLYRFKHKSIEYVRVIYKDDSIGKIAYDDYDYTNESNLLFGSCLFKSKTTFDIAYAEAMSGLADEQCLKQIHLAKITDSSQ